MKLPSSWARAHIADLITPKGLFSDGDWVESKDQDPGGTIRLLQLADIGDGRFLDKSKRFVTEEKFTTLRWTEVFESDVLVARMPDPLGRACLMPSLPQRCITVVDVAILRPGNSFVIPKWLMYFINSPHVREKILFLSSGTTRRRISRGSLANISLPVPTITEQKRIADKLDSLLKRVDACREKLDRVPLILKRFRQAVVAAAASGVLTEGWRSVAGCGVNSWKVMTLQDVTQKGRVITYGVIKLGDEIPDGTPCLRTSNVRWLNIDTDSMKRIAPHLSLQYPRTILEGGEVLVNVRGTLGGVAPVTPEMVGWNVSREVAVVPADNSKISSEFLALWIGSEASQRWLTGVERGVAYTGINIEDLRTLPVNLPSIDEQREIVRRVEKLFAFADRLEARYLTARKQVDQLTPSLLAKAFRGELVEQDPNDEPASVLLERIKVERAKSGATRGPAPARSTRSTRQSKQATPPPTPEPAKEFGTNIPQRLLAAMQAGRDYGRAEITAASGISDIEWSWAIKQLKEEGKVRQTGERRGARYRRV